jgi:hypothetical protein
LEKIELKTDLRGAAGKENGLKSPIIPFGEFLNPKMKKSRRMETKPFRLSTE